MGKHKKHRDKSFKDKLKEYKFLVGIPHCHSSNSTGKGTPYEAFQYARSNGLDFLIITDHNKYLNDNIDSKNKNISKWDYAKSCAEKFNKKYDDFIALIGFETNITPWGHLNILNSKYFFKDPVKDLNKLLLWSIANKAIICINHPHSNMEKLPFLPSLNEHISLIEVGNGSPPFKYTRYDKRYFKLLDMGWKLGAINSQDNHRLNFGDNENLTVVLCEKKSISSFISALKNKRTYSTESRTLKLLFSINQRFMGEEFFCNPNENLSFYILAEDNKNQINKVEIFSSGGKVVKSMEFPSQNSIKYFFNLKSSEEQKWYVVKIHLGNDKYAFSSPIFINLKK